jgi:hypothetical protein
MGPLVTWQDVAVFVIVGAAVAYVVRKFLPPARRPSRPVTFVSIQQLKSKPKR